MVCGMDVFNKDKARLMMMFVSTCSSTAGYTFWSTTRSPLPHSGVPLSVFLSVHLSLYVMSGYFLEFCCTFQIDQVLIHQKISCVESESFFSPFLFHHIRALPIFKSIFVHTCFISGRLYTFTCHFDHTLQCSLALRPTTSSRSRTASGKRSTSPKKKATALHAISVVQHVVFKCELQTTWAKRSFGCTDQCAASCKR